MRKALIAATVSVPLAASFLTADQARAAPFSAVILEPTASLAEQAQYPYFADDRYYYPPHPRRRTYPPSIYYAPPRYYEPRALPYYSRRVYDYTPPAYVWEPDRPSSCGQYRYWNGEYCADARYERPYVGPKW